MASLWKAIYSKTCHLSGNSNLLVISFIISSYILFLRSLPVPVNSNSVGRGKLWKFSEILQLNLSTMATLGKKMAVVEGF